MRPEGYYADWTVPRQHLAASAADVPLLLAALDSARDRLSTAISREDASAAQLAETSWEVFITAQGGNPEKLEAVAAAAQARFTVVLREVLDGISRELAGAAERREHETAKETPR